MKRLALYFLVFTTLLAIRFNGLSQIVIENQYYCSPGAVEFNSTDANCGAYKWFDLNGDLVKIGCVFNTGFINDEITYTVIDTTKTIDRSVGYAYTSGNLTGATAAWTTNDVTGKYSTDFTIKTPVTINSIDIHYTALAWVPAAPVLNVVIRNGQGDIIKTVTPTLTQGDGLTYDQTIPLDVALTPGDYAITLEDATDTWFIRNNAVWIHTGGANYNAGGDLDYDQIRITGNGLGNNSYGGAYQWDISAADYGFVTAVDTCQILPVICSADIDLNTWVQEGEASQGNWIVDPTGTSVEQTINGDPTFFVGQDNLLNVRITGRFTVNTAADDDIAGFVMGYQSPMGAVTDLTAVDVNTIILDWKQLDQTDGGGLSQEGLSILQVNGTIDFTDYNGMWGPIFWGRDGAQPESNLLASNYNYPGWEDLRTYNFEIDYMASNITVRIDGEKVFDVDGCYEPGRFGFYNQSQSNVIYDGFSYSPVLNMTYSPVVCLGDTTQFSYKDLSTCDLGDFFPNNGTLTWNFGDGSDTVVAYSPNHVYQSPGNYVVTLTYLDDAGCTDSLKRAVVVTEKPQVDIGEDILTCAGQDTLTNLITYPGLVIYTWYQNGTEIPNENTNSLITQDAGTYILEVNNLGCSAYDTALVGLNPDPVGGIDPILPFCVGETTTLSVTLDDPTSTINWIDSSRVLLSDTAALSQDVLLSETTTFHLQIMSPDGCASYDSLTVVVNPLPILELSAAPDSLCEGESSIVSATGADTYTWDQGLGLGAQHSISPTNTTTYLVSGSDVNSCEDTALITVYVYPNPTITALASPASICLGDSITLSVSGADQYLWSTSDTASSFVIHPTSNQTLSVTGNTFAGCSDETSVDIVVNQPPNLMTSDTTVCTGNSVDLEVSGAINYLWTPNTGLSADNISDPISTVTATLTYTIIGTDNNGCTDTTTLEVEVLDDPVPVVQISNNSPVCNGSNVDFTVDSSIYGGYNPQYEWFLSSNNGTSYTAQGSGTTISLPNLTGTELIRVHMTSNEICVAPENIIDTSNVSTPTIIPFPDLSLFEDLTLCPGETGALQVTDSASFAASFRWFYDGQFLQFGDSYPITNSSQAGSYQVIAANEQCADTSNPISVSYVDPYLELSAAPDHLMGGDPTTLTANTNASPLIWSSDNTTEDMSTYSTSEITVSPIVTTTYQVSGLVQSCHVSDSVMVQVVSPFVLPYFFSPNADDDNDLWIIEGLSSYPTYIVTIHNRWGSVIRRYENNFESWDGTNQNGTELPDGTYYYVVQWGLGEDEFAMSGHVTITR